MWALAGSGGQVLHEMMSHMDVWPTTATMVGPQAPPKGEMMDNNGKPIFFDGIDNSAYVTGKAKHSARDGGSISTARTSQAFARTSLDPDAPDVKMAWKALYSSKDTWMGPTLSMGAVPSIYNLDHGPYEKYDMMFNGAVSTRNPPSSPGRYAGMDNGWALSLIDIPLGIQQVDHQVSEHRALRRCLERHDPESSKPEEPIALRSDDAAEDRRSGRGLDTTGD